MSSSNNNNNTSFERYDEEFQSLLQQIETSLQKEPPGPYTENLLAQCDDLLKQMALEARSVDNDASLKRELLGQVRTCKSQWQALQQQAEKRSLLSSSSNNSKKKGDSDRLLLQKNEDMLAQQNDTLERARRTMQETESVALEITEELGHNREKLLTAHGRVREVSGLTGRARRILQSMNQRAMQQKMVLYGVAVSLVLGFLVLLWIMWR